MKVYPDNLAGDLKKRLRKLYIVSGDEQLLVQEATDMVRRSLRSYGFIERELFHVEAGFDWSSLLQSASSMSLFVEKKLIEVRLTSGRPGSQGGKVLTELLDQLNGDNVLLLVLPRVGQDVQRSNWFKTLFAEGAFVQIWPIEAKDLPGWLTNRFRDAGFKVTRDAVELMADRVEGNLLAAAQEIERLKLKAVGRVVDVREITDEVTDSARYDVFKLLDSAIAGDAEKSIRMIKGLKAEGVEIMFILAMTVKELRNLEKMKTGLETGRSRQTVLKSAKVWKNREALVSKCLHRQNLDGLRRMVSSIGQTDRVVKGLEIGDPWRILEDVILDLSGKPAIRQFN